MWEPLRFREDWADRILAGMTGLAVGDSYGLPWEGLPGGIVRRELSDKMVGGGTWGKPRGTWSDDTAQALAMADSLASAGLSPEDFARRMLDWYRRGAYTPDGDVFDIGYTTRQALLKIELGAPREEWGVSRPTCGGLMRNFPIAVYTLCLPLEKALYWTHEYSRVTHSHPEAMMAAGLHTVAVRAVFAGLGKREVIREVAGVLQNYYQHHPDMGEHARHFSYLLQSSIPRPRSANCRASRLLHAALWAFQEGKDYRETVMLAVGLGDDTDTVGAVAGSLAGAYYGRESIPREWIQSLRGLELLHKITMKLLNAVMTECASKAR